MEDKGTIKLTFDCKEDSDALFHLYGVCLDGVYDIQLYEVMMRQSVTNAQTRRNGMSRCIENYLQGNPQLLQVKNRGRNQLDRAKDIWARRPIAASLLEYAAIDTQVLFMLYDYFNKRLPLSVSRNEERLRVSSERFVRYFREKPSRSNDMFERNSFLPLNIIPDLIGGRLNLSVPNGDTQCVGCRKYFPRHDLNSFQLSGGTQKCRVCKEIEGEESRYLTRKQNRQQRNTFSRSHYEYYYDNDYTDCYGDYY